MVLTQRSVLSRFHTFQAPLSRINKFVKGVLLGMTISPVMGALFYANGHRIPGLTCPIRALTGIPCPTCGMTRAFVALAQGQIDQAIAYHLFSPALFIAFVVIALHVSLELWRGHQLQTPFSRFVRMPKVSVALGLSFLAYYLIRLGSFFQTGELVVSFQLAPLRYLLPS